ncbi:MAG: heavy metal sensor histidine kinase [Proteobacteria bacterium]|nr:heavy metal sensor histidine kinase [Pseudomonadota bacterium]
MIFGNIRFKLTLWYIIILGIVLTSFSTFLYLTLARSLYRGIDTKIRSIAEVIASSSTNPYSQYSFGNLDRMLKESFGVKPLTKFIQVLDESGRVGRKSDNLRQFQLPISIRALKNASQGKLTFETTKAMDEYPLRMVTVPVIRHRHIINIVQVATSLEEVEEVLKTLLLILWITVPSVLVVASLGGLFLANKALRPVDEITKTARMITSKSFNQRIKLRKTRDEIGRLAETFNDMISRLGRSFRQIRQFTADASHELRTPLTILKGEIEVGLRKRRRPEEYKEILTSNLEEVNHMAQIVDDLLFLSKADMGEAHLEKHRVNLAKLISEVQAQAQTIAMTKDITIHISNDVDGVMIGDRLKLRQLLLNLVDNGIKYTPEGGEVRISLEKDDGRFKLRVIDDGIGIAPEDQAHIFDRFFRVDKVRSRDAGGSGLGLSICKWIVEAHGGEITVESDLGTGSIFTVTLPLAPPDGGITARETSSPRK